MWLLGTKYEKYAERRLPWCYLDGQDASRASTPSRIVNLQDCDLGTFIRVYLLFSDCWTSSSQAEGCALTILSFS